MTWPGLPQPTTGIPMLPISAEMRIAALEARLAQAEMRLAALESHGWPIPEPPSVAP